MKIKILSKEKFHASLMKAAIELDQKIFIRPEIKNGTYFESLTAVRKILTDTRLDVWRAVRDQQPESITKLTEILNRDFKSVHRDVMLLKDLGLIKLIKEPGKRGYVQRLVSKYDELHVAVA